MPPLCYWPRYIYVSNTDHTAEIQICISSCLLDGRLLLHVHCHRNLGISETNSSASLPVWSACCFLFLVRGSNSYVVLQVRIWRTILDPSSFLPLFQSALPTLHLKVVPEGTLSSPSPPHSPSWVTAWDSQNHSLSPGLSLLLSFCAQQDPLKAQI